MPKLDFLKRRADEVPGASDRIGIIDIGSNSIRLVVYEEPARIPAILFNEKVMAGLGKGLAATGALDPDAADRAVMALGRFRLLAGQIGVARLITVATAAVREASNGPAFLARLAAIGLDAEVLSGDAEAEMSAQGVLAGIPDADGIVGDLGGGSLELARIAGGEIRERASFPLGVLRVAAIRRQGPMALRRTLAKQLREWVNACADRPFYMVGGSWRALARLDMVLTGWPLPIIHQYEMPPASAIRLVRALSRMDRKRLRAIPEIASARAATLPDAALLLAQLARTLTPSRLVVSSYGLREGVLHAALPEAIRRLDPLISAAREEGRRQGRFAEHGDLLAHWIAPLFASETAADDRLRHAACLLGDVGWRANPEFRAERGLDIALHGNWVGIDAPGRAMIGQALFTSFGGAGEPAVVPRILGPEERQRAIRWGLAMRLGQRLSGGVAPPLEASAVAIEGGALVLRLGASDAPLYGETVERRHKVLATAMGLGAKVATI